MGYKLHKSIPAMQRELDYLLYDLCVIWGFCIDPDMKEKICHSHIMNASIFARMVLKGEGFIPGNHHEWSGKIEERFRVRFGREEIDESTFVDRVRGEKEQW